MYGSHQHIWTVSSLTTELESWSGVNTANRDLESFSEEKGGLFGCTLAAVLAYSGTGNGMKVGAVDLGFLVNVPLFTSRVGWEGTINFHFWESHLILLDFVEPIRVRGTGGEKKKRKEKAKPESI